MSLGLVARPPLLLEISMTPKPENLGEHRFAYFVSPLFRTDQTANTMLLKPELASQGQRDDPLQFRLNASFSIQLREEVLTLRQVFSRPLQPKQQDPKVTLRSIEQQTSFILSLYFLFSKSRENPKRK
jgi:hypothetical protein